MTPPAQRPRGFTLIELLVVISIIALLVSILLPALGSARNVATDLKCLANARSGTMVWHSYFSENQNYFPPIDTNNDNTMDWGYGYGSWYNPLRPYTTHEGDATHANWNVSRPVELTCPTFVSGVWTYGYPHLMYSVNWKFRYRTSGDAWTSWRTDEISRHHEAGLVTGANYYRDLLYYYSIDWFALGNHASGPNILTPVHGGRGISVTYIDGHGEFVRVGSGEQEADYSLWGEDIPFTHRSFWGRTTGQKTSTNTTWFSPYYKYSP